MVRLVDRIDNVERYCAEMVRNCTSYAYAILKVANKVLRANF